MNTLARVWPVPGQAATPVAGAPFVFLHIPKTAGTSFLATLANCFGEDRVRRLEGDDAGDAARVARLLSGQDESCACLAGHIPWHLLGRRTSRDAMFTILRDPVQRVLSLFRFIRRMPAATLHAMDLRPDFSFAEFVGSRSPTIYAQVNNGMTRMLSGDRTLSDPAAPRFWREADAPGLADAMANLGSIAFGLAEDAAGTARVWHAAWRLPLLPEPGRDNTTTRDASDEEPARLLAVAARNTMDQALYSFAAERFRERVAALANADPAEPDEAPPDATPGAELPLSAIPGRQGFHPFEPSGFAWLRADRVARLRFRGADRLRLRLRAYAIRPDYPIGDIELSLNGRPVAATAAWEGGHGWFSLTTEPLRAGGGVSEVTIRAPYHVPVRFLDPSSRDDRSLGVAVAGVSFIPAT